MERGRRKVRQQQTEEKKVEEEKAAMSLTGAPDKNPPYDSMHA